MCSSWRHDQVKTFVAGKKLNMLKNQHVLVTGGAGFIGSHLVPRLVEMGATVRVADNLERGKFENLGEIGDAVDFKEEDLRDLAACRRVCQGIDVVFHLASKVGGIGYYLSRPAEVMGDNTLIDTFMLRAAVEAGVSRYLYAGSAHVYPIELQGSPDSPLIREEQAIPAHPELSYGWAKLMGEKQIEYAIQEGVSLRAAIVRIIGAYGPRQDLNLATGSAIPVFTRRAIEYPAKGPFVVLGTGAETRSYCYIDDIIDGFLAAVRKMDQQQLVGPVNLGAEGRITIGDLAQEVIRISGKDIKISWDSSHPTVIWGQALDCSLAKEILDGWTPKISLREGLQRVYSQVEKDLQQATLAKANA
jgi:GDP-D-mannose 3', 5'-epimerase